MHSFRSSNVYILETPSALLSELLVFTIHFSRAPVALTTCVFSLPLGGWGAAPPIWFEMQRTAAVQCQGRSDTVRRPAEF